MHYILDYLFAAFLFNLFASIIGPSFDSHSVGYLIVASLIAIVITLIFSLIVYIIFRPIFIRLIYGRDIPQSDIEYTLMKRHLWSWIFVFDAVLISAEIIASWQLMLINDYYSYIPLWVTFIFCGIMAIINANALRKKSNYLRNLLKEVNKPIN